MNVSKTFPSLGSILYSVAAAALRIFADRSLLFPNARNRRGRITSFGRGNCKDLNSLTEKIFLGGYTREEWVDIIVSDRSFIGIKELEKFVGTDMTQRDHSW